MANSAVIVRIAQAIADEIAGTTFNGISLDPNRSYADWQELLEDLSEGIYCDVVPVIHRESRLETRGTVEYVCDIDVGIRAIPKRNHNGRVNVEEVDRLVHLVEAIHEFFCDAGNGRKLSAIQDAVWVETKIRQTYVRSHLRDNGQFTAIIRLTYEAPAT